jgi:hypothetical protein
LEWSISRVETPQHASPNHVPTKTDLFPSANLCQTSPGFLAFTPYKDADNSPGEFIPVRGNLPVLPSMPKLNLVGITDTETKPDIVSARSGFLTAREPSPVILATIETSLITRADDAATL